MVKCTMVMHEGLCRNEGSKFEKIMTGVAEWSIHPPALRIKGVLECTALQMGQEMLSRRQLSIQAA